jgi:hypothetical protein
MNSKPRIFDPPFIAAALLLATAALATQAVLWSTDSHLIKSPLELRKGLYLLPESIGPWQKISDQQFSHDMTEELGTRHYILWTLHNDQLPRTAPGSVIRLLLAYYSDVPDATPDVQDHHYLMGGRAGRDEQIINLDLDQSSPQPVSVQLVGEAGSTVGLTNFYLANGSWASTAKQTQKLITHPAHRYAYWAKIELVPGSLGSGGEFRPITRHADVAAAVQPFLNHLLPIVRDHLPDWKPDTR